jgi:hypothetical protein
MNPGKFLGANQEHFSDGLPEGWIARAEVN